VYALWAQVHARTETTRLSRECPQTSPGDVCGWEQFASIARHLKVAPQTVADWVTDLAEALPNAPLPNEVKEAEMDEMFTFIGDKKTKSILSLW